MRARVEYVTRPGPYIYYGVLPKVYSGLKDAESKGGYVNRVIKLYPYEYRGRWPKN